MKREKDKAITHKPLEARRRVAMENPLCWCDESDQIRSTIRKSNMAGVRPWFRLFVAGLPAL